ncbi:glycosyltransferase family 1 protein [Ornithinibacillus californiensis]|uniref:glycosyltransferase family 1 protein n=1 Tax=Ornithinibacillus californiensis TaxID=161536 RepID=UPI00064DD475|nr:glycosyltransferase family 1 protein [Ornithinibacillus californiensis]
MGGPVRVLHAVVNMNRGGAETLIMNLYRNMDRRKVQFDFLTSKEGVFDEEIREMGGVVHRIPYVTDVGHFGYQRELTQFFAGHKEYKIIHSHMDKMSGLVLKAAKKAGVPVRIAHSHNTQSEGGLASKLYKWYAGKHIIPNASHLFACSQAASDWLYKKKAKESTIVKNGIESERFKYSDEIRKRMRHELMIDDDAFVLGHIGRFNRQKNHTFLLDVFAEVSSKIDQSYLILVGDGSLREAMEKRANELGLHKNVLFLGIRDDITDLLQAFDLFVFPSLHEGLPVTLIEAQGAGLPCVISKAITREVDMGMGLIEYLPIDDRTAWSEKIVRLSKNRVSRNINNGILAQKGYDIHGTAERLQTSYVSLGGI